MVSAVWECHDGGVGAPAAAGAGRCCWIVPALAAAKVAAWMLRPAPHIWCSMHAVCELPKCLLAAVRPQTTTYLMASAATKQTCRAARCCRWVAPPAVPLLPYCPAACVIAVAAAGTTAPSHQGCSSLLAPLACPATMQGLFGVARRFYLLFQQVRQWQLLPPVASAWQGLRRLHKVRGSATGRHWHLPVMHLPTISLPTPPPLPCAAAHHGRLQRAAQGVFGCQRRRVSC